MSEAQRPQSAGGRKRGGEIGQRAEIRHQTMPRAGPAGEQVGDRRGRVGRVEGGGYARVK